MELGKEDENCRQIINKSSCFAQKKLKHYIVLQKKFKHIYCKYLHGEQKSTKRKNANSLLSMLWQR